MNPENLLFVEKYRPKTISDCILPDNLKKLFQNVIEKNEMQNFIFHGGAGCGKTTVAKILCETLGLDYLFINASEFGNIDTLRTTVRSFASTVSLSGGKKVVIFDEGDGLNQQSSQPALRAFYEEFSKNCCFIITCNYLNRIIEPIQSRSSIIDFKIPPKEKPAMASQMLKATETILKNEKIEYDKKVLVEIITKYFPDFRRTLGEIQRYSICGKIDVGILANHSSLNELIDNVKNKKFNFIRKWVATNPDVDQSDIFTRLEKEFSPKLEDRKSVV